MTLRNLAAAPLLLALAACLAPSEGPSAVDEPTLAPTAAPEPTPAPTPVPTEAELTGDGGRVTFAGDIILDVPAGALPEATTITVDVVPDTWVALSPRVDFGPDGLTFDAPITVTIPLTSPADDPRFYWSNGIGGYQQLPATLVDGVMTAQVSHFSSGFLALNGPVQEVRHVVPPPAVDVLFVVDNSCSMAEEQAALTTNFPVFLDYFLGSGIDYHVGVTTTDTNDPQNAGRLRQVASGGSTLRYIDATTSNPTSVFTTMATVGTAGWFDEKGRDAAHLLLETNRSIPRNQGFWRDDAALHIVFLSDEDDQSTAISQADFEAWMATAKSSPDLVMAHTITGLPGQTCAAVFEPGLQYLDYAAVTGGVEWDICTDDWADFMDELGLAASGAQRVFFLDAAAQPGTLVVSVELAPGVTSVFTDDDYTYDETGPSITFTEYIPPPGATVVLEYTPL